MLDAGALLAGGGSNFGHDVRDPLGGTDNLTHGDTCLINQFRTGIHLVYRVSYQRLDLLGSCSRALRQAAHFGSHDRKSPTLLAGSRRLHGGVQRQDVGLERDALDDADNVHNLLRTVAD